MSWLSLIRHGEVHNPDQVYYGRLPGYRLSERGEQEATTAAHRLQRHTQPVSHIYHSPLLRTTQTATIMKETLGLASPLRAEPLLLEIHSPYDGTPIPEMAARNWDFYADISDTYEQPEDILARVQQFIAQVRAHHLGEHVAAVTHGDVITFTLQWLMGLPLSHASKPKMHGRGLTDDYVATASITTLTLATPTAPLTIPTFTYTSS